MSLLEVSNLYFSYANESLYEDASMRLFEGEHACLVGPNGTGKSTLLKLLDRILKPDKGTIFWQPHIRVGYLDQYAKINPNLIVKDYLYEVFLPLFNKEKEMEQIYHDILTADESKVEKMLLIASSIQEDLIAKDFYQIKSRVGNIIHGLGLTMDILTEPIKHLSGGMRAKIILGKLLLEEADVLLLDEPTNFLDVKHIEWLTKFLNNYEKAFIVVSHQESFINDIAKTVFALESTKITRYKGDYQFYLKERDVRYLQQEKAYDAQTKFIKETEDFIKKNIVRASTTKRAQSRRKVLEKIVKINKPKSSKTYHFNFPISSSTGKDVLVLKDLEIGYEYPLVEPLSFIIRREEKVVITGKNGIGKSTLIKTIMGEINKLSGEYKWIDTAKIAYFKQDEIFNDDITAFEYIHYHYPHFSRKEVMQLLSHHGINYEMANRKLKSLSGGEQTKVRLAILYHQKGNVLILDEPTNHLDKEAKDALKEALMNYQGTLILVSHEKDFFSYICDVELTLFSM